MKEALFNILTFHIVTSSLNALRRRGVLKVSRFIMSILMIITFSSIIHYQVRNYLATRE